MSERRTPKEPETPHMMIVQCGHLVDCRPTTPRGERSASFPISHPNRVKKGKKAPSAD